MVPFFTRFRHLALQETRWALVPEYAELPTGQYGFLDLYCDDPRCDCRIVILQVVSADSGRRVWATIDYAWETDGLYQKRVHDVAADWGCGTARLSLGDPQTEWAPALLRLFRRMVTDWRYAARLRCHYGMFKQAVRQEALGQRRPFEAPGHRWCRGGCPWAQGRPGGRRAAGRAALLAGSRGRRDWAGAAGVRHSRSSQRAH